MQTRVTLVAVAALWAAVLSTLGIWKYTIFRSDVDDGIFMQVLTSVGSGFHSTVEGNVNHLLVHFSPILFALAPIVHMAPDTRVLIVAQAVLHALVIFPVYAIARRRTSERRSLLIACGSMCYPVLWASAFTDFHENAFVPLFAASLAWAIDAARPRLALLAALALTCTKEDEFVIVGAVGLITIALWPHDRRRRLIAAQCTAIALAIAALYFGVIRPAFHSSVPYWSLHFYDWSFHGGSPLGFAPLLSPIRLEYVFWALAPLAFLPLRSRLAFLALPGLVEVLASHEAITISLGTHYVDGWLGFILAAFAAAAGDIVARPSRRAVFALVLPPLLGALTLFFNDPMARWYFLYRLPDAHDAQLASILARLPQTSSIGTEDEIFAHLGNRPNVTIGVGGDIFLYDRTHYSDRWQQTDSAVLRAALAAGQYRLKSDADGIVLVDALPRSPARP